MKIANFLVFCLKPIEESQRRRRPKRIKNAIIVKANATITHILLLYGLRVEQSKSLKIIYKIDS